VMVNGHMVFDNGKIDRTSLGKRLKFEKDR